MGDPARPGIVHRLDKGTSGLLVWPGHQTAYDALVGQLAARTVDRRYLALVWGAPDTAAAWSTRRSAGRHGTRRGWPCQREGGRPAPATRCWSRSRARRGRAAGVPARDRADPPDPGPPRRPSATRWSATTATTARASPWSCPRPFLHAGTLGFAHPGPASRSSSTSPLPADLRGSTLDGRTGSSSRGGVGTARSGRAGHRADSGQAASPRAIAAMSASVRASRWLAHVLADVGPDGQQDALALVVAGAVLVGLAEVADHDRAVDRADDLAQGDLGGSRAST